MKKLHRLFEMGPTEIAFRSRQEIYKAMERLSPPPADQDYRCHFDRSACDDVLRAILDRVEARDDPQAAGALQAAIQQRLAERFFAGLTEEWAGKSPLSPEGDESEAAARELIARADAVCRGEFDILGYGALSYGQPVNWHLDPTTGKQSPKVHWSRIDFQAPVEVGDYKVVWELSRHQWLLDLGQAWRLTGDEAYAECYVDLVTHWIENNPYTQGINWCSALEAAMRSLSWLWGLALFRGASALTPERFHAILGGLQRHASFIDRYLSVYYAPNTHLTGEALALYAIGTLLPELRGAEHWRALGRRLLLEQLPSHVPEHGVYFEKSTRYQYYTAEIYLHFAILADRNDDPLPDLVKERLGKLVRFLLHVRRPDGTVPQIGDTDGGWLCPLLRRDTGDYRGLFSTAASFLGDNTAAWAAGSFTHEAFCLLGSRGAADWEKLTPEPPALRPLSVQGDNDYVVMRTGWEPDAHHLVFDTGTFGCPYSGAHGHADLLSIQASAFGENYLVDPGTGCYTTGSGWREHFRSTRAHSTVRVDNLEQAETSGPFDWVKRPSAELLHTEARRNWLFAVAQHEAYARLPDPVIHRRRVWLIDSALWLVVDDLLGATRHTVEARFQFAPLPVSQEAGDWIRAQGKTSCLMLKTFSTADQDLDLTSGVLSPPEGWYSPNYGRQVPAPVLTVTLESELPLRLATLVIPSRDRNSPPPSVEPILRGGLLTGLSLDGPNDSLPAFGDDIGCLSSGMERPS